MEDNIGGTPKEVVAQKEIKFSGFRILDRVAGEGLWRYKEDDESVLHETTERLINPQRVIEIAKEEIEAGNSAGKEDEIRLPSLEELEKMTHTHAQAFIEMAEQVGWLPTEVVKLAHRMTRVEDIRVIDKHTDAGGLNSDTRFDRAVFPDESGERRNEIWVTEEEIRGRFEYFQNVAREMDMQISPEQLLAASVGSVAVHEWAHSAERGLETQYGQTIKSLPDYDEDIHYWNVLGLAKTVVFRNGKGVIQQLLPNLSEKNQQNTHTEQFASGFEFEAVRFFLVQAGLPEDQVANFYDEIHKRRENRLTDFQTLREKLDLPDSELEYFAFDIKTTVREGGLPAGYIPYLWEDLGYFAPYRLNQLNIMLKNSLSEARDTTKMQEDLIRLKNPQS